MGKELRASDGNALAARVQNLIPLAVALVLLAASSGHVPEPEGLWQGPMHSDTPDTLKGASVIDTEAFARLRDPPQTVVLDVAPAEEKPASISKEARWMPIHYSIPSAVWLPGAGSGSTDPAFEHRVQERDFPSHRPRSRSADYHFLSSEMLGQLECRKAPRQSRL